MTRVSTLALLLTVFLAACSSSGGSVEISDARMGEPTGPNAALYLTVSSDASDRLVGATTDVAARVEVHETVMDDDGTMTMSEVEGFDLGPDAVLVLEPGGKHLMLIDAERVTEGDTVEVTLRFEQAGDVAIEVPVVAPQDAMGDMEMGDDGANGEG